MGGDHDSGAGHHGHRRAGSARARRRRANIILAVVLGLVALGFYVFILWRGAG